METPELTILEEKQVIGESKLKIFDVISPTAVPTDTTILRTQGIIGENGTFCYFLKNTDGYDLIRVLGTKGKVLDLYCDDRSCGIRLSIDLSYILKNGFDKSINNNGLISIKFGYYPADAVSVDMENTLNEKLKNNELMCLGDGCVLNKSAWHFEPKNFKNLKYYGYKGNIYVCMPNIRPPLVIDQPLSNGEMINSYYSYSKVWWQSGSITWKDYQKENVFMGDRWVKIEPITWIGHPKDNVFISEKVILGGLRFNKRISPYDVMLDYGFKKTLYYETSELKYFIDNYLAKDIVNPIVYNYLSKYNSENENIKDLTYSGLTKEQKRHRLIKKRFDKSKLK